MKLQRQRKPMRLPEYDYSLDAKLAVDSAWHSVLDVFANVELDEFVVMPNHSHGIVWIMGEGAYRLHPGTWKNDDMRRDGQPPVCVEKFETLSNIIGAFKTTAATRINKLRGVIGAPVWQKSYYDRIIRNDYELEQIQEYIRNNPIKWEEDRDNPTGVNFGKPAKSIDDYWNEIFPAHP